MITIDKYKGNPEYHKQYEVIKANSAISYGGLRLYNGKRDYLMQSPPEFASTLVFLKEYFQDKTIKYFEIGTASGLTNSMIWNNLNIEENVILDNLECPGIAESLIGNLSFKPNTTFLIGDSTDNRLKTKVKNLGYKYDLMLIDGNHNFEYVSKDFEFYHEFLSDDGLLLFHDIDNDAVPGVRKFINENKKLQNKFTQIASFIDTTTYLNKTTFGSQCGIGIFKLIK